MKIAILRQILKKYEDKSALQKFLLGERKEILDLKLFLSQLAFKKDHEELNTSELFDLIKIVASNTKVNIFKLINRQIKQHELSRIINLMKTTNRHFKPPKSCLESFLSIYNYFFSTEFILAELNKNAVELIINFSKSLTNDVISTLRLIDTFNFYPKIFRPYMINFINLELKNFDSLVRILNILHNVKCFNDISLMYLEAIEDKNLYIMFKLFELLALNNVVINEKLIIACNHTDLNEVLDIIKILTDQKQSYLDTNLVLLLLQHEKTNLIYFKKYLYSILNKEILRKSTVIYVLTSNDRAERRDILLLLYQYETLPIIQKITSLLINRKINNKLYLRTLKYLDKIKILNENTLSLCHEAINQKKIIDKECDIFDLHFHIMMFYPRYEKIHTLQFLLNIPMDKIEKCYELLSYIQQNDIKIKHRALNIILNKSNPQIEEIHIALGILVHSDIYITEEIVHAILALNEKNISRLVAITENLLCANLLDEENFNKTIALISNKLPPVTISNMEKISRNKDEEHSRSTLTINKILTIFKENNPKNNPIRGGSGKIIKAYKSEKNLNPLYCIKKLDQDLQEGPIKHAKKEVKYQTLLGREAKYVYNKSNFYVISHWLHEKSLHDFKTSELLKMDYETKIHCLISLFSDINTLHQAFRIHGDLCTNNVILNIKDKTLKIIDFGNSSKAYKPPRMEDFSSDIGSAGFLTQYFFPEYFAFKEQDNNLDFNVKEKAIHDLSQCLTRYKVKERCTAKEALNYCQLILNNLKNLNNEMLKEIKLITICKQSIGFDEAVRGKLKTISMPRF